jgi:hypothetical protein
MERVLPTSLGKFNVRLIGVDVLLRHDGINYSSGVLRKSYILGIEHEIEPYCP